MKDYIVNITPWPMDEFKPRMPMVGCLVRTEHDPSSPMGLFRFWQQLAEQRGQVIVGKDGNGQKVTLADRWKELEGSEEWTEEAGWTHLATSESDAPDNIA